MNEELVYKKSENLLDDVQWIIDTAQKTAFRAVNITLVRRNWLLGKRIAEEIMKDEDRAKYGAQVINRLSEELTRIYGKGFTKSNLYNYYAFFQMYPHIFHSVSGKSTMLLSWTHYRILIQEKNPKARAWYEREALEQTWSARTLQRNIYTQYYDRLLLSKDQSTVITEMKQKTAMYQAEKETFVKNPYVLEFLGLPEYPSTTESKLESTIILYLQYFLMELGKGYAFVARQQHIHTEKADYYIDLVFFNYILNCFVLIDLKIGKITHQDVGQMDMYVRMYDEMKKTSEHNPTLGIVLCSETDEDIARYSVLHGNEQLFATKYRLCLPSEEQLRAEIEAQKTIFYLQHPELKNETGKD